MLRKAYWIHLWLFNNLAIWDEFTLAWLLTWLLSLKTNKNKQKKNESIIRLLLYAKFTKVNKSLMVAIVAVCSLYTNFVTIITVCILNKHNTYYMITPNKTLKDWRFAKITSKWMTGQASNYQRDQFLTATIWVTWNSSHFHIP